jgi:hypothetical protein
MWAIVGIGYLVVGLAAAGFTLAVFPPQEGYRPPLLWLILAVVSYVILWPFLAMIGLGFVIGRRYNGESLSDGTPATRPTRRQRFLYRALYEETPN